MGHIIIGYWMNYYKNIIFNLLFETTDSYNFLNNNEHSKYDTYYIYSYCILYKLVIVY